ncbi:MAG: ATP-binding protein [Planctomycetota bacterium]|jgi:serine/threonine-protein kinase RsbW
MGDEIKDSIEIGARTENLQRVREFMSRQVELSPLPAMDRNKVVLAVDEAVANIVRHAYESAAEGVILVSTRSDDKRFEVAIFDSGSQFDPNKITDPDMQEHVRLGKKTGLGIFLMRQIMDEVEYSFREGRQNELRLVKYATPPEKKS